MYIANIRRKSTNGGTDGNEGTCIKGDDASLSNVSSDLKDQCYKHYIHTGRPRITHIKYGEKDLIIADEYINLADKHKPITNVSVYFNVKHDGGDEIKKPLLLKLKIKNNGNNPWYENTGDSKTWRRISGTRVNPFYKGSIPTQALKEKLNKVACKLHNLHFLDIYKTKDYECPCGTAKVKVTEDKTGGGIPGYIKYEYSYTSNKNSVRYKNLNLKWKNNGENKYDETFPLVRKDTPNLTVYYCKEDEKRKKKPLLMQVSLGRNFGGIPIPLGNDGDPYNSTWTVIEDIDYLLTPPDELRDKLQELKHKLFRPVIINITEEGKYTNPYCKSDGCKQQITYPVRTGLLYVRD
ncbi:hypothetical protein BEWA_028590 [Theileria equi strain WA]|uniref:Uncharacterized protein n=1 Tax=Theileria equi strain WA TaxID=1537102 RepID=L0AYP9_THEEQ|nr:hypothetical protein BEWA_028590 [Theileria equi strain WA]AFZ80009.1 hypothetical protein BEWA_028590 [Theileria equi strain WA]|eukprot:XP_004829675.1 hypothetical protein BEWA_028590 [Theileria equi strain WA]